jgi:hypothetical protein
MAKDPAVLLYTSDFLTGTMTMSNEQVGKYIRLLCLQHQKGSLTEHDMLSVCITYDIHIFNKFIKDGEIYYNKRLKEESDKRSNYCNSRRNNRIKGIESKETSLTYDIHMENENEDVIINKDIINKAVKKKKNKVLIYPDLEEFKNYCKEKGFEHIAEKAFNHYSKFEWKDANGNVVKDWKRKLSTVWFDAEKNPKPKSDDEKFILKFENGVIRDKRNYHKDVRFTKEGIPYTQ